MSDEITQATQAESDFAPAWRYWELGAGAKVEGKILNIDRIDPGAKDRPYPCLTLQEPDGAEIAVHASPAVLRRELARRNVQIGDSLTIVYQGKRDGGQNPDGYHAFRVVGGQGQEYNWAAEIPANERESRQASSAPPIEPTPAPGVGVGAQPERSGAADRFGDAPPF